MKAWLAIVGILTLIFVVIAFAMPQHAQTYDGRLLYPLFWTYHQGHLHGLLLVLYVFTGLAIVWRWRRWQRWGSITGIGIIGLCAWFVFFSWIYMNTMRELRHITFDGNLYRLIIFYDNTRGTSDVEYLVYECDSAGLLCRKIAHPYHTTTAPRNSNPDNLTPLDSRFIVDAVLYVQIADERVRIADSDEE